MFQIVASAVRHQKRAPSHYRLFMALGPEHTMGGRGAYIYATFHALADRAEHEIVPETLKATSAMDGTGTVLKTRLCAYLKKSEYHRVGNPDDFLS